MVQRFVFGFLACASLLSGLPAQSRPRVELPYEGGILVITADRISKDTDEQWIGEGDVVATYQDTTLKADRVVYQPLREQALVLGNVELTRGLQWLQASRAEIDLRTNTGVLYDARGFTDEELYLQAKKLRKTGTQTYEVEDGFLTACEGAVPKWSFTADRSTIELGGMARISHTVFRIKQIPIFYFPYLLVPTGKKERSTGFMLPTTGNSNNKGRRISQSFYLVLGRSADLMVNETYFSKRGFGHGFTFRTRPNQVTHLELDGFLVDDRRDQGGASLNGVGETRFGNSFRAVADFNLVTNFLFRQVFSDNFFTATQPTEDSRFFVTNNFQTRSLNFHISRQETAFPARNVVTRKTPAIAFKLSGQRLFDSPLYLDLDASAEGLSRVDRFLETPAVTQRIDLFPQLYASMPLFQGLRLTPRLGLRETFYSDSLQISGEGRRVLSGNSLERRYLELNLDLKGWGMSRIYSRGATSWKHLIEPQIRYRYITGIEDFQRVILFDEQDAVANTHAIEYALFNRLFLRDSSQGWSREWLSVKIGQKYFFDPSFDGALQAGEVNQFFPLNTLTGFPYGTVERRFSPVTTLVRLTPEPHYNFDIRGDFDVRANRFRNFSITGFVERDFLSFATTYFLTSELEEGLPKSNQLQGRIGIGNFTRGFSAATMFSYDASSRRFLNYLTRVNYFWDCCGISLEFQGFDVSVRSERQLGFSFFLKGIGTFGTIRRPESRF